MRWPTTKAESDYLAVRQQQNRAQSKDSRAEKSGKDKLKGVA
jgi:hypothetical protein